MEHHDLTLVICADLPTHYFDEFRRELPSGAIRFDTQLRKYRTFNLFEWIAPTAVVLVIGQSLLEKGGREASFNYDQVGIPEIQSAVAKLAEKLFCGLSITAVVRDQGKVTLKSSSLFSIRAKSRDGRSIKFVFTKRYDWPTCQRCVEQAFRRLFENHALDSGSDRISQCIAKLAGSPRRTLYLVYDEVSEDWVMGDFAQELLADARRKRDIE